MTIFAREFDQIQALNREEKKLTQEITASQQDIIKVDTQSEAKTKDLIQAKKEEIAQAEREVASTPALLAAKNRKLQQLNEELKALQQLGTIRETPDGFASQTDKVLSALNERHEKELLKIRENKERQQQTQAQYDKARAGGRHKVSHPKARHPRRAGEKDRPDQTQAAGRHPGKNDGKLRQNTGVTAETG